MSEVIEIKQIELTTHEGSGDIVINEKIMADCFVAITLSMLQQTFMSSDLKYFIFQDMFSNLKENGYTEEELDKVKIAMQKIVAQYNTQNDFMG